ncbi:MAG: 30S ribosomal protein S20 [Ilumatobacter sp.]|nr:30S ribosomal protein S20 [Ilumatobacter sp.]
MANIKSQKKRNITNAKAHERNKAVRSEMKQRTKTALNSGDEADVQAAIKRIDTAAQKGIIHKNAAARKKSRLMKQVNAAS